MSVKYPGISELDHEQVRVFNSYGCHGIIKQWLLRDCEEPIEEISELLFRYTVRILCLHPEAPERTGKL